MGGLLVVGVLVAWLDGSPRELKQASRGAAIQPEGGPVLAVRGPAPRPTATDLPLHPTAGRDDPGGNPGDGAEAPKAAGDGDAPGLPKERIPLEVLVVDPQGGGVPGARVRARWGEWDTAEARADQEGRLTMNVPPGASSLIVTGWDQSDERTFFLVHQHPLEPNQRSTRVVVRSGSELSGRLLTEEGTPIPYAAVRFVKPGLEAVAQVREGLMPA